MTMEQPVLIAHMTDLHIQAPGKLMLGKLDPRDMLANAVAYVNGMPRQPDLVAITGDITDLGTTEEFSTARSELDRLHAPYIVIPGNHDEPETFRACFDDLGFLEDGEFIQFTHELDDLTFIGLDSNVKGFHQPAFCETRAEWCLLG